MPFDSNGVFSLTPGYNAIAGQTIQPSQHNPPLEDISASGLSLVLVRDGRAPMTGTLNMGGFKVTNALAGSSANDVVVKSQLDSSSVKFSGKTAPYTAVLADNNAVHRFTNAGTVSLTAAATLGANWNYTIIAAGGDILVDPNAAELINGLATFLVPNGQVVTIYCDGTAFTTDRTGQAAMPGYVTGLVLTKNTTDPANDVDISAGSAASDGPVPILMRLSSAITKRLDAAWVVGTNQGGLDTGAVADGTYFIWLIRRSDTGVTDALFSLSSTAPTMPANYDTKVLLGSLVRTTSVNSSPAQLTAASSIKASPSVTPSGTAVEFPGLPSNAKRVTILLVGVSTSGSSDLLIQIGDSGGIENTGYLSHASYSGGSGAQSTIGYLVENGITATSQINGTITISLVDPATNRWNACGNVNRSVDTSTVGVMSGTKSLSATLDRLRLTTVNGTDTFDAGTVAISWEV